MRLTEPPVWPQFAMVATLVAAMILVLFWWLD